MSTFQNITEDDLDLKIDGVGIRVAPGDAFTIPDAYDDQIAAQPYYKQLSAKDAKNADPVVAPLDAPTELEVPEPDQDPEPTPEAPATTEGDN